MEFIGHVPSVGRDLEKQRIVERIGRGAPASGPWPKYVSERSAAIVRSLTAASLRELDESDARGDRRCPGRIYLVEVQGPGGLQYVKGGVSGTIGKPKGPMGWLDRFLEHESLANLHNGVVVDAWISPMLFDPKQAENSLLYALDHTAVPGVVKVRREYFRNLPWEVALAAAEENSDVRMHRMRTERGR